MIYKIKITKEEPKTSMFILFPRYCGSCALGFAFERVNSLHGDGYCPKCGGYLFNFKRSAIEKYRKTHTE